MSVAQQESSSTKRTLKDVEEVIAKSIRKIGCRTENELCKYLPVKTGGYMHHFTLKKMKNRQPEELASILDRYILQVDRPPVISPKQRAARGSRKRKDHLNFTRNQLERMLSIAKLAGDKEIVTILSPKKSIAAYKKELLQSIKNNKVDHELWNNYAESMQLQQSLSAEAEGTKSQN